MHDAQCRGVRVGARAHLRVGHHRAARRGARRRRRVRRHPRARRPGNEHANAARRVYVASRRITRAASVSSHSPQPMCLNRELSD